MKKAAETPHLTISQSSSSTSSFSSQDFEFSVSLSPAAWRSSSRLCSADELFFEGRLLPLQLIHSSIPPPPPPPPGAGTPASLSSPISTTTVCRSPPPAQPTSTDEHHPLPPPSHLMNSTLDSSRWSSDTTSSRDSTSNSNSCDSSRRTSSATTDDNDSSRITAATTTTTSLKKLRHHRPLLPLKKHPSLPPKNVAAPPLPPQGTTKTDLHLQMQIAERNILPPSSRSSKAKLLSSIFISKGKNMSKSAKRVFQKYINKMKPLYEKRSHHPLTLSSATKLVGEEGGVSTARGNCSGNGSAGSSGFHLLHSHSFSGNLSFPKKRHIGPWHIGRSCPTSKRSSPSHSGVLVYRESSSSASAAVDLSSTEELQSAIQSAIAHCKESIAAQENRPCDSLVTM